MSLMMPRWSVMATMADSSRANLRSASSLSERLSASSVSKSRSRTSVPCNVLSLIVCFLLGRGRLDAGAGVRRPAFELLEAVAQLVARNAQEFRGARLVTAAPFDGLPHERDFHVFERDALA